MKEPAKAGFFVLAAISMRPASKDSFSKHEPESTSGTESMTTASAAVRG